MRVVTSDISSELCVAHRVYTQQHRAEASQSFPLSLVQSDRNSLNRMTHQWSIQFHCPIEKIPLLQS